MALTHRVVAIEQQAHGHTPDINRPLTYGQMADDTVALVRQLGVESAGFFGYSMGAGIALEIAIRRPSLVAKLVVASLAYNRDGIHSEVMAMIEGTTPTDLAGSVFHQAYLGAAPDPGSGRPW
jgi:pimeloyl-ACP methyl ester carboxylesterase